MTHARIPITVTLVASLLTVASPAAADPPPPRPDRGAVHATQVVDRARSELEWQLRHGGIPLEAWQHVAQCETQQDWRNPGHYAGGLGIYTRGRFTPEHLRTGKAGTWEGWGGEEYAPSPDKATVTEQIVIANRIAIFGWRTTFTLRAGWKGAPMTFVHAKPGIGVTGWGCVKTHRYLKRILCRAGHAKLDSWRRHCRKT